MKNKFIATPALACGTSVVAIALAFNLMACSAPVRTNSAPAPLVGIAPAAPPAPASADFAVKQEVGRTIAGQPSAASEERMIVRTVNLGLEVQDSEKSFDDVEAIATKYKGYVANKSSRRDGKNRLIGTIALRIPAESLDKALKEMKAASLKVLNEVSNANDVTDQYTDLNARQKNLEATEAELTKLLATVRERTGKAEEILAVYDKLTQIRGQIEQIKGQINVINRTTSLATVTVTLTPHDEVQILEPDTWAPNRTVAEAVNALKKAVQGIADLAIWFLLFVVPVLVVIALVLVLLALPFVLFIWLVRWWIRRRAKANLTA